MRPVSITKNGGVLSIEWDDGHKGYCSLASLRDQCPCAACQGETVLLRSYVPPDQDRSIAGRYEISHVQQVGNYALQVGWKDGHDTGIYAWEYLRGLCECEMCKAISREKRNE